MSAIERVAGAALLAAACIAPVQAQVAHAPLRTRWAAQMNADHPLPEYPRPQMVRHDWVNLNGRWEYAITSRDVDHPVAWDGSIVVPFPVQSQLSGVERSVTDSQRLWYHHTFTAPEIPRGGSLLLHFGAVDWDATIYVNGTQVIEHRGGYDPFTVDITSALRPGANQELTVAIWDPTDHGPQPRGKQVLAPKSIWYTAVTGIWQTVWLEPVRAIYLDSLVAVPDIDAGTVTIHTALAGDNGTARITAQVLSAGQSVATATGTAAAPLVLHIPAAHLWSPSDPFLYDLRLTVAGGDTVTSYFGMRKIAVARDSAGVMRLVLNNHPLFEYGMLDQGWWPDGLYTAPTEDARRFDIATMKSLGFNMIRKHVKVEPERWYRDADSMGMLVWQDMPSGDNNTDGGKAEFERELHRVVASLRDHPSIVMWVPFNEGWGEHDVEHYVAWIKGYDPTRLVDDASGWTDRMVGDVIDLHDYPGPGMPATEATRAAVLGEFGGLGLPLEGHTWLDRNNWGYRSFTSQADLGQAYRGLLDQLRWLIGDGLSAAVYTQTTDVEIEVNGLMTYDRAVIKLPPDAAAAANALWQSPPRARALVETARRTGQTWRYTTMPPDTTWFAATFDDRGWKQGPGGFGTTGTPGAVVRTTWNTGDIWMRRHFTLTSAPGAELQWRVHHDEDADIYLNGVLVARLAGYTSGYVRVPLDAAARGQLHQGDNLLAVHVHQTRGGQYIDLGLDEVIDP
jgi:hypothetical protein